MLLLLHPAKLPKQEEELWLLPLLLPLPLNLEETKLEKTPSSSLFSFLYCETVRGVSKAQGKRLKKLKANYQ
jgi:hypothetical protein